MLQSYVPALVFVTLGAVVGVAFAYLNTLFGPKRHRGGQKAKTDPYECGLPSDVQQGFRFGISFYMIAMLFILFDIEVIFLYPVAVQLLGAGAAGLIKVAIFVSLLAVAFLHTWRRGALNWK